MKVLLQFTINDWRNILRDASLRFFLLMPILFFAIVVWGIPALVEAQPALAPYKKVLVLFMGVQASIMMGFIFSILLVEEREANLHIAFRTLPSNNWMFLIARLLPAALFAWIIGFLTLLMNQVWQMDFITALKASALFIFPAPILVLMVTLAARDKVQAMTFFKGFDLLVTIPALYYIIPDVGFWKELFRLLPFWWVFDSTYQALEQSSSYLSTTLLGLGYNLLFLIGLSMLFNKYYWRN